ncbi:MAG: cellobiose phosphorylase, partial [Candidatus Firestonebacteria bacterium]
LIYFFNLIQTDGFNPLVIKGMSFLYKNSAQAESDLEKLVEKNKIPFLKEFLKEPFTPGSLIFFVEENRIKLKVSYDDFLNNLISDSSKIQEAEHGEGFWSDHWAYCLDLLENYLAVYPDKLKQIIFENRRFTYFDNTETVRPRSEKYLLYHGLPRQLHSVVSDKEKNEIISKRQRQPNVVRRNFGSGDIYYTSLINKLLCLTVNKMASLDPFGTGIEMEANKPNWYDALNGLPALFGSSSCETFELKRLINFILNTLQKSSVEKISVTKEMLDFLYGIGECVKEYFTGRNSFFYWDKSYSLKEDFRQKTKLGLSGEEEEISSLDLKAMLESFLRKLKLSLETAYNKTKKNHCAYFINEVVEYDRLNHPYINPRKFKQVRLPLFLESQMHALRLAETKATAKSIYTATKASVLFDKKLKMYKVTENLKSMPEEIGRCRVFSPGWLEHESIWLHMEYKYLLEILKQGLYKEFYEEFKNILIPFQNPQQYGRSILENSSFIVSSAFKDKRLHGNGFVARLSGSTAEFLEIWLTMNTGKQPFFLNQKNELCLSFRPALAGWLFDKKGLYTFNFLSKITLTYHNPKRKDTFAGNGLKSKRIVLTDIRGKNTEIISDIIPPPYAEQIRSGQFKKIDIHLS